MLNEWVELSNWGQICVVKMWFTSTVKWEKHFSFLSEFILIYFLSAVQSEDEAGCSSVDEESYKTLKQQEEVFRNLDAQYEMARSQTHTQRGMGLGFTSSMRGMDAVWKRSHFSVWNFLDFWFWCQVLVHQTASILACMGVALTLIYWKITIFCKYQISDNWC